MTDNCEELHDSLAYNWPDATLLLCIFHILQQVWRWLYESCHGISKTDRVIIMALFRNVIYANSIDNYVSAYSALFESNMIQKYKNCAKYFEDLCNISERWALSFRNDMLTRGSNTNNYIEAQFLVIKDSLLKRQRQYNINMLFDKLTSEFEDHYKHRLLSVADGTFDGVYSQRFKGTHFRRMGKKIFIYVL